MRNKTGKRYRAVMLGGFAVIAAISLCAILIGQYTITLSDFWAIIKSKITATASPLETTSWQATLAWARARSAICFSSGGFGYDPIFFVEKFGKTFAELTSEQKNSISHRGRALFSISRFIESS